MAKPATEARLAAAAKGYTQVIGRGNAHIITKNPTTGKCAFDSQVGGGWHYGDGQETDTAWTAGTAPWNYQMVKANYNVFALSQFNQGQIIKWVDPGSGQYVTFQPMALQWTNNLNQIQQISMPQSVAAQVNDDILYWPAAYGSGRNFRYQACPDRLCKQLIIDSPSALPSTSYDTLELNFIISVSSGVNIMVDGAAWNKKSTKDTVNSIAFQPPGGAVLWSFAVPTAYDSSGTIEGSITGSMRLKKQGNSLYVSVRFPKSWIDSAIFPIVLDPTVDYQVAATGDAGYIRSAWGDLRNEAISLGDNSGDNWSGFARFLAVTIPAGATIDVAYLRMNGYTTYSDKNVVVKIYADDQLAPTSPTTYAQFTGITKTTAYSSWDIAAVAAYTWYNSPGIENVIQELVNSNSYAAGSAMQFVLIRQSSSGYTAFTAYHATYGPKLHIEYTEAAAGGNPFYAYAQQ